MSAADEIQAAIDKLTALRDASYAGPWTAWHPVSKTYYGNSSVDAPTDDPDNPIMVAEGGQRADIDLIVTLHATINAQIGLLEVIAAEAHGCNVMGIPLSTSAVVTRGLTLARAINGTIS